MQRFAIDGVDARFRAVPGREGLRLDAGVETGSVVGTHYDPMLAKVIAVAPTRAAAARRLAGALGRARVHGLTTNRDQLVRVLQDPDFVAGDTTTAFLATHAEVSAPLAGPAAVRRAVFAAALAGDAADHDGGTVQTTLPAGWRNVGAAARERRFTDVDGTEHVARWSVGRDGPRPGGDLEGQVAVVAVTPGLVVLETAGVRVRHAVARYGDLVHVDSPDGPVVLREQPRFVDPADVARPGSLVAPMPGTVVRIGAAVGDTVAAGQPLVWLEAMKMEHVLRAPVDGVVEELAVTPGRTVDVGSILARVAGPTEG